MKLLFATTNAGKLAELQALVQNLAVEVLSPRDFEPLDVEENGHTFEENATLKAQAYSDRFGLPALADDSGLCVDALQGLPGVRSARFSQDSDPVLAPHTTRCQKNNEKLLKDLQGVPLEQRGARFCCALSLCLPGQAPWVTVGECAGRITHSPRGSAGFGYDPLFEIPRLAKTFAELSSREKNQFSHRARAFQKLVPHLSPLVCQLR